jgi:hypothetical protein
VCFAPGWFINTKDETYQAAWKRFYVAKPNPDEGSGWLHGTQLVLMTSRPIARGTRKDRAEGRQVLDSYAKSRSGRRAVRRVKPQCAACGGLVPRIRPAAGAETQGQYRHPEGDDSRPHTAARSRSLWLTGGARGLVPAKPE